MHHLITESAFYNCVSEIGTYLDGSQEQANKSKRHNLAQLLQQHQHQDGWILLLAPSQLPDKSLAEQYQLPLHKVLVIHPKQISDLFATLQQALLSPSCRVIINFANQLTAQQDAICRKLAIARDVWFYQCAQAQLQQTTH